MPSKNCILLLGLVVYLSNQVFSLKCYHCDSENEKGCDNDPKQPKFEGTCGMEGILLFNAVQSGLVSTLDDLISNATHARNYKGNENTYDCGTLQVSFQDNTVAIRSCLPSIISCEDFEFFFEYHGVVLEHCFRCSEDLCNSQQLL